MMNRDYSADYNQSMMDYQKGAKKLRLGYVPGVIRHHYHGSKKNRRYTERWRVLINHQFSPKTHLEYKENGLIVQSANFSEEFMRDIMNYFEERKEDD
jgi:GT2 family glycosyltransferase